MKTTTAALALAAALSGSAAAADLSVPAEVPAAPPAPTALAPAVQPLSATAGLAPTLSAPSAEPAALAGAAAPDDETPPAANAALPARAARPAPAATSVRAEGESRAADSGAAFDGSSAASPSLWARARALLGANRAAAPGPGATVRLGREKYRLESALLRRGDATTWSTRGGAWTVTLRPPTAETARQAALWRRLNDADPPLETLAAISDDGSTLVRPVEREELADEALSLGLRAPQREAWAELAAKLIRAAAAADLSPGNLVYESWRGRWRLVSLDGLTSGSASAVLAGLLSPRALAAGVDPGEFLSGVRGRLGATSPEWARVQSALALPEFAPFSAALAARDRARPSAPEISFSADSAPAAFGDRVVSAREAARALGDDPLRPRAPIRLLHTDDPGKLNTRVYLAQPPGRAARVVKVASRDIIRRELAVRRIVRRLFGAYFWTPSALGVLDGAQSYLVMELAPGERSYALSALSRDQRAALGVLARGLGLGDVNPGNVLFSPGRRPALIDFEQSLHRVHPVASRLPDESIAEEMPWLSRAERNHASDFAPAIAAWRRLLADPAERRALAGDFAASGFSPAEAASLLATLDADARALDWTLQNDVDFVNQFVRRPTNAR